jgi:hypothetical protein
MMKKIPSKFSFEMYPNAEKYDGLRQFFNEFSSQFRCEKINKGKEWEKRVEKAWSNYKEINKRDAVICYNSELAGIQQFSVAINGMEAYAEGIYVREKHRKEGIGMFLREVLFYNLMKEGIERFYIGDVGPWSAKVLKTDSAQGFAEKDISLHKKAIIDLKRTPKLSLVSSDGLNLLKYEFMYAERGIR